MGFVENFLSEYRSSKLFGILNTLLPDKITKKGAISKKRSNLMFGDRGLIYRVWGGGFIDKDGKKRKKWKIERKVIGWDIIEPEGLSAATQDAIAGILMIKRRTEKLTGKKFRYCSVMKYPNGSVGISPHKDKEMSGKMICGVSIYDSGYQDEYRELVMQNGKKRHVFSLTQGSLYIIYNPTNNYWMHSIPKNNSKRARISLTFRE